MKLTVKFIKSDQFDNYDFVSSIKIDDKTYNEIFRLYKYIKKNTEGFNPISIQDFKGQRYYFIKFSNISNINIEKKKIYDISYKSKLYTLKDGKRTIKFEIEDIELNLNIEQYHPISSEYLNI